MGKFLDKFKRGASVIDNKFSNLQSKEDLSKYSNGKVQKRKEEMSAGPWTDLDSKPMFEDDEMFDEKILEDNANILPAQKPESFHHFILENQYKDLERSIRGFKDVYNKEREIWEIKRKQEHCFTDEEAEEILRTCQSHLATDIKLSFISKESFPLVMDAIYKQIEYLFRRIAEYKYGRYGTFDKQSEMKAENLKIFLELITRIQANYSRAIQGSENKSTHGSVRGQESLQGNMNNFNMNLDHNRRWS